MNDSTAYVVPKDRQDVTIHFDSGADLEGSIFLEYAAAESTALQKVSAFLEGANVFFPAMLKGSGKTEFLRKKSIRMVEMDHPDADNDAALALMRSINVVVTFTDGITLSGALLAEVPQQKARLSDCLNLPSLFLTLKVRGRLFFINKNAVEKVVHADREG